MATRRKPRTTLRRSKGGGEGDGDRPAEGPSATRDPGGRTAAPQRNPGAVDTGVTAKPTTTCRAATFTATLDRVQLSAPANGYTKVDVTLEPGVEATPSFSLTGVPAIEALAKLTAQQDGAKTFDVYIDRHSDQPFPTGEHELDFVTTMGTGSCTVPITLSVGTYTGPRPG